MREIGALPRDTDPTPLSDYLLSQGVTTKAVSSADGWSFWVHDENKIDAARDAFNAFVEDPDDPRFADAARAARAVRLAEAARDREFKKNFRPVGPPRTGLNPRGRPVTFALMAACVVIFLVGGFAPAARAWLWENLAFFPSVPRAERANFEGGLNAIRRGEVWRLVTPIFLHVNLVHLIFNIWATSVLGTAFETLRGGRTLLAFVLVTAVLSNAGQYVYEAAFDGFLTHWGGISGVVYALFGYLWMKSQFDPSMGIRVPPGAVRTMLLWLALGFTGILPMANGAHLGGLLAGMLLGLARL